MSSWILWSVIYILYYICSERREENCEDVRETVIMCIAYLKTQLVKYQACCVVKESTPVIISIISNQPK